jgi:hypothetical protein
MNSRLVVAFLAVVTSTGCIVVTGGGGSGGGGGTTRRPGDVTFTWSFAGKTCSMVPEVKSVRITIPGQTIDNAGVFPCLVNDYPGIVLKDFAGGTYDYTIEAFGYASEKLYVATGSYTVNGSVRIDPDLTPVGGPNSYAYLTWRFPALSGAPNPDCSTAGVTNVLVSIDGAAATTHACTLGFGTSPGVQTRFLTAGKHTIDLIAVDSTGYAYYSAYSFLTTQAGAPVSSEYSLAWAVGGVSVKWSLTDGSVAQTCAQAGVTDIYINFVDAQGNLVYGSQGDPKPCTAAGVEYSFLKPGTYSIRMIAAGTNSRIYESSLTSPPQATVVAGQFPVMSSAINVQLFKR